MSWTLDWPSFAWGLTGGLTLLCLFLFEQWRWLRRLREQMQEAVR